jgi:hypothetical protein
MAEAAGEPRPKRTISTTRKATIYEVVHVRRKVKHYCVSEVELRSIANDNTVSRWSASAGWSLVSFAVGLGASMIIESNPSDLSKSLAKIVIPLCVVLAIVFFTLWNCTRPGKNETFQSIFIDEELGESS